MRRHMWLGCVLVFVVAEKGSIFRLFCKIITSSSSSKYKRSNTCIRVLNSSIGFFYKILSCNTSSWSQPYSWTQKKKTVSSGVFLCFVKHTNTLRHLLATIYFHFSCLIRVSRTARRQMIWTSDFRSFLPIVPSLCTQTWLGECFYWHVYIHDQVTPYIGNSS